MRKSYLSSILQARKIGDAIAYAIFPVFGESNDIFFASDARLMLSDLFFISEIEGETVADALKKLKVIDGEPFHSTEEKLRAHFLMYGCLSSQIYAMNTPRIIILSEFRRFEHLKIHDDSPELFLGLLSTILKIEKKNAHKNIYEVASEAA